LLHYTASLLLIDFLLLSSPNYLRQILHQFYFPTIHRSVTFFVWFSVLLTLSISPKTVTVSAIITWYVIDFEVGGASVNNFYFDGDSRLRDELGEEIKTKALVGINVS